jgi:ferric-dicitrate binding protein FerR (iron transport regulator)
MTLSVPFGKSTDITLPDGSIVYLHPGSRLVFPVTFEGDQRVVKLEGEAYFKVAKDASHPFVVMTEHFETTVLGTEFNIKTGNSEQGTAAELTLVSGSVAFKSNSLKPVVKIKILKNNCAAVSSAFWVF